MRLSQCMRLLAVVFLTGALVGFPVFSGEVLARGGGGGGRGGGGGYHSGGAAVITMGAVTAMAVTLAAAVSGANRVTRGANTREIIIGIIIPNTTITGPTPPTSM